MRPLPELRRPIFGVRRYRFVLRVPPPLLQVLTAGETAADDYARNLTATVRSRRSIDVR